MGGKEWEGRIGRGEGEREGGGRGRGGGEEG